MSAFPGASATSKGPAVTRISKVERRIRVTTPSGQAGDWSARCLSHHIHDPMPRPGRVARISIDAEPYTTRCGVGIGWSVRPRPDPVRPDAHARDGDRPGMSLRGRGR